MNKYETRFVERVNTFDVEGLLPRVARSSTIIPFAFELKRSPVLRLVRDAITKSCDSDSNAFCNRPGDAIKFEPEETITGQKLRNVRVCIYIGSCKYKLT